jgi:DNA-directed RNA polymerase specialized sigma24 family protein
LAEQSVPHRQPRRSPTIGELKRVAAETVGIEAPSQAEALHQAEDTVCLYLPNGRVVVDLSDPQPLVEMQHTLLQVTRLVEEYRQPVLHALEEWHSSTQRILFPLIQMSRLVEEYRQPVLHALVEWPSRMQRILFPLTQVSRLVEEHGQPVLHALEEWHSSTQRILFPLIQMSRLVEEYRQPVLQALEALRGILLPIRREFLPGSFLGDVLLLLITENSDEDRYQATRRLATEHLTWHSVYCATPGLQQRWERVRPAFEAYCREYGLSHAQGWEQLVTPIVCDLVLRLPRGLPLGEVRWYLARELRKEIERELLGRTANQHDPLDRLVVADAMVPEEVADTQLDVWLALQQLDPDDRALLVEVYVNERPFRDLATQYGVSERTLRRRVANALVRLQAALST